MYEAKEVAAVAPWDRAHQILNETIGSLQKEIAERESHIKQLTEEVSALHMALSRIAPPSPTPITSAMNQRSGSASGMTLGPVSSR